MEESPNPIDTSVTSKDIVSTEEKRLTLAYENLTELPQNLLVDYAPILEILDLSHNQISNVDFLSNFQNLTTLILDHNLITNETTFPKLPSVSTLWINHNDIGELHPFIQRLSESCPNVTCLSLMGNQGCPSYLTGGTYYEYCMYRLFVISWMDKIKYLDDRQVSEDQKCEAQRLFGRPFLYKYRNIVANSFSNLYFERIQKRFKDVIESFSRTPCEQRVQFHRPGETVEVQDMGNFPLDSESSTSSQTGFSNYSTAASPRKQRNSVI